MPIIIFIILKYDIIFLCMCLWHNFVIKNCEVFNIYMIGYSVKTYYLDLTITEYRYKYYIYIYVS